VRGARRGNLAHFSDRKHIMTIRASILKPGYLISLKTSLAGGISYARVDIEGDHIDDNGARVARWETKRKIDDPKEYEAATIARSKARALVTAVCAKSAFGLLCPTTREEELTDAIAAARAIAERHNDSAPSTRVEIYVLAGRIAQDDAEAARAISSEMRELMEEIKSGIADCDPERIREAATKARNMAAMLSPDVAGKVAQAIEQARAAARAIVKRIEKSGEIAADVVAQIQTQRIDAARFAFLDMEDQNGEPAESEAPAGRALDLPSENFADYDAASKQTTAATYARAYQLDL